MNDERKLFWLLALAATLAAAYYYIESQNISGASATGEASGSSDGAAAAGSDQGAAGGIIATLRDYASSIGEALGIVSPRGIRNNNPGNLRFVPSIEWVGQRGGDSGGYAIFDSAEHGIRALGHQLSTYARRGANTVADIISTWAPANENDTLAYINAVADQLGVNPTDVIDVQSALPALAAAIIQHENGEQPYDANAIAAWVYEA